MIRTAWRTARRSIAAIAVRSGAAERLGRSAWRGSRLLILCYHGVSVDDEHVWDPTLFLHADRLRRRLELLRQRSCTILPLPEALERLRAGELPPRAVVLTFDDGNYDFLARAVPVLREFDAPATVYLTTYYAGKRMPVFDPAVGYLLWKAALHGTRSITLPSAGTVRIATTEDRALAKQRIRAAAADAGLDAAAKDRLLDAIADAGGVDIAAIRAARLFEIMRPDEVRAVAHAGFDVQLHTHRHRVPLERERFIAEIEENRERIAACTGRTDGIRHFCYPSGVFEGVRREWLIDAGVDSAVTCKPGMTAASRDPLFLPRFVDTGMVTESEFAAWCLGLIDWIPRRA